MILPIKDILDQVALENGHTNWDLVVYRVDHETLHSLYLKAILKCSERAFVNGWNERAKRVGYNKNVLDMHKTKEISFINSKLFPK